MRWRKDDPKAPPNLRAYDPVSLSQGNYPYWNADDGVWQNPDGSKTKGSGPTWVNPNGFRQDNYERDVPTQRTVSDVNQINAGWRTNPEAPKYGPTTAQPTVDGRYPYGAFTLWKPNSEKQIWEEPTLHEYPYFNPFTGAVHNVDGSRTLEDGRTITSQPLIDNWWGNDPRTAGPYPPKK